MTTQTIADAVVEHEESVQAATERTESDEWHLPDLDTIITEDDEPVDNVFSAKQQRMLVETLYNNVALWNPDSVPFLADANVGVFISPTEPPLVPDAFLSLRIKSPETFDYNKIRAYFVWVFAKTPDVVVEIISNRKGGEKHRKMTEYAALHIPYYAVFDPFSIFREETPLQLYRLNGTGYKPLNDFWMEDIGLGLRLWTGEYEGNTAEWLRWCDERGNVLPTGKERGDAEKLRAEEEKSRAEAEKLRAEEEKSRAEAEKLRADNAESRAAQLAAQLRALGITPET
jgi:Uma2 family endonuclease